MTILTLVLAFMDISGLPAVLFVHCRLSDVTPYIISLMVNFLIMGFFAWLVLKLFGKDWSLGLRTSGLVEGLKKYASVGVAAGIFSCVAFVIGLAPFDYKPSVWKILIEGVLYYFGVAIIEELYVRGLFLNIVDKIAHKKEHHEIIAIWVSSVVFGLGHIPGMIGMEPLVLYNIIDKLTAKRFYFPNIQPIISTSLFFSRRKQILAFKRTEICFNFHEKTTGTAGGLICNNRRSGYSTSPFSSLPLSILKTLSAA